MAPTLSQASTPAPESRSRSAAHQQAIRADAAAIAAAMQALLGQQLTAVIAGVAEARAVGDWARGNRKPHPKAEERLRNGYQVAMLLGSVEPPDVVRAWFIGMNPDLDDRPPAMVLAEDPVRVMQAARAFVDHG
jgi:hypothetical protein